MKNSMTTIAAAFALGFCLSGCDVDQIQEGELPTIDVDAEPGTLPEYDVEGPDVDVEMEEKTVTMPDVDVDLPNDE